MVNQNTSGNFMLYMKWDYNMDKDKICNILGDMTAFVSLQLLAVHGFNEGKSNEDKVLFSAMMNKLCEEIGLDKDEITAITTYAQNYINRKIDGKEEE